MNNHPDEELLSAFLDGELTEDERRSLERRLAEDPSAKDVLDEFSDVSQMVQQLPRPAAPAELREAVLEEVRATPRPTVAANSSNSSKSAPSRRYWILSGVTVAGLLVAVFTFRSLDGPNADLATDDSLAMTESVPAVPTDDAADLWGGGFGGGQGDADAESARRSLSPLPSVVDVERLREMVSAGDLPVPGESLHDVVSDGDQIILVEYTVVDVQDMFGKVQVVLAENGIQRFDKEADAAAPFSDTNGALFGIYVDAPDETLLAALDAIKTLEGVVSVVPTSFTEADSTPGDASGAVQRAADASTSPFPPSAAPVEEDRPSPGSRPSQRGAREANEAGQKPRPQAASERDEAARDKPRSLSTETDEALPAGDFKFDAYQLTVPLVDGALRKMATNDDAGTFAQRLQAEQPDSAQSELLDSVRADMQGEKADNRRRVVIVFVERANDE